VVTALLTASFVFWIEIAQAVLVTAVPLMIVTWGEIRLARRVLVEDIEGSPLRRRLVWRRFINQLWGVASISSAAGFVVIDVLSRRVVEPIL
ncbi:MAG: hypothetical protein AAGJ92_03260, partial [Pseudomonadota bacterium]